MDLCCVDVLVFMYISKHEMFINDLIYIGEEEDARPAMGPCERPTRRCVKHSKLYDSSSCQEEEESIMMMLSPMSSSDVTSYRSCIRRLNLRGCRRRRRGRMRRPGQQRWVRVSRGPTTRRMRRKISDKPPISSLDTTTIPATEQTRWEQLASVYYLLICQMLGRGVMPSYHDGCSRLFMSFNPPRTCLLVSGFINPKTKVKSGCCMSLLYTSFRPGALEPLELSQTSVDLRTSR